ncbi:hypothetical protein P0D69_27995 [Paraburkholderia sediminicola]|uniref:hypothetical protein n=1 Tax=Paraburkholderia sediminicola TaxID=458836 RepID=UPI0038B77A4D
MIKELSMTPDAIRKRELRAQAKMAELAKEMALPQQAEYTVLKVGHAFIQGKGNAKPKKDSIWGILLTGDTLVKFFGRRGSAMRFKQEPITALDDALDLYMHKLAGTDAKKLKHVELDTAEQKTLLGDDWPQPLFDKYKQALADGKVDLPLVVKPAAWEWPTAAKMEAVNSPVVVL